MFTNRLNLSSSRTVVIVDAPTSSITNFEEKEQALCELITQHENAIAEHAHQLATVSKQEKYKALAVINEQMLIITGMYKLQEGAKKHWQDNIKKKLINERIAAHQNYFSHLGHYLEQIKAASINIVAIVNSYYLLEEVFPILEQQKSDIAIAVTFAIKTKQPAYQDDDVILKSIAAIESLQKEFNAALQQSKKDKDDLFARKDIELTDKLARMHNIDQAITAQLKEICRQLIIERVNIEDRIAMIKSIEDEADAMLAEMRQEAERYQSAFPGMQTAAGIKNFTALSALARGILSLTSESLKEDALILDLPTVGEQRLALYKREKTHNIDELKTATIAMQLKFKTRADDLWNVFHKRITSIVKVIQQTQADLQNETKHLDAECQRLIQVLETYPEVGDQIASSLMWQTVSQLSMEHDAILMQIKFFALQKEVMLWGLEIGKQAFDKSYQDDYVKIWSGLKLRIDMKNFSEFDIYNDAFKLRQLEDQATIKAIKDERELHAASLQTLINLLHIEKDSLLTDHVKKEDVRIVLLEHVLKKLNDHKEAYLTKVLGGNGKDIQENDFHEGIKNIIEKEFIHNKGLRVFSSFSDRNVFTRWFYQLLNKIHRALPDKLKSKKTCEQHYRISFFASKQEIAVANTLENASNAISIAQKRLASPAA